jgi:hypothetical protein
MNVQGATEEQLAPLKKNTVSALGKKQFYSGLLANLFKERNDC